MPSSTTTSGSVANSNRPHSHKQQHLVASQRTAAGSVASNSLRSWLRGCWCRPARQTLVQSRPANVRTVTNDSPWFGHEEQPSAWASRSLLPSRTNIFGSVMDGNFSHSHKQSPLAPSRRKDVGSVANNSFRPGFRGRLCRRARQPLVQ